MNNLATVVLTSTRQHYNLVDIDKVTISDTLYKSKVIRDSYKFCHLKTVPGQENIAEDKKKWFKNRGFHVIETIGDWTNDNESHGNGLIKDMQKAYNNYQVNCNEYVLNLEGDWVFNTDKLDDLIKRSMEILSYDNQIIYHRYSRVDQPNIVDRLEALYRYHIDCYTTNREFSFNPFISRSRDMKYISNLVAKNRFHSHVEMAYEIAAKYINNNDNIFSFTPNGIVQHRGGADDVDWYKDKLSQLSA